MHALKNFVEKLEQRKSSGMAHMEAQRLLDERDIYRYRKQRGLNLGSWFVLERWLSGTPFRHAVGPASSDYDIACGSGAKEILETHWDTWITEKDWIWMSERGINSVRIPIGYYHLVGKDSSVVKGTPFANYARVFEGAWERILNAVETASRYGIGVLIDLHSAPGKQNGDAHSGINGPVEFFKKSNLSHTVEILKLLAMTFSPMPHVVGIQLVNEPQNNGMLSNWYKSTLDSIRTAVGLDLPLYIHDAWNTDFYASLVQSRTDFVILDHHLYRCFTPQDHQLSGDQHASALPRDSFARHAQTTRGNFVVAEFSAALNPKSFGGHFGAGEQDRQRRVFANAELEMFEKSCGGWWVWAYKKDGWDAGWSFRDMVRAEIFPNWVGKRKGEGRPSDPDARNTQASSALSQHTQYWSSHKGDYEHWRFEAGFLQGWDDAVLFFSFTPSTAVTTSISELGFQGQWLRRRTEEHIRSHGEGAGVWEFGECFPKFEWCDITEEFKEHGFSQGVQAATSAFMGAK